MISIVFGEVEGDGGPCLTPKIIEGITILTILIGFVREWAVMGPVPDLLK